MVLSYLFENTMKITINSGSEMVNELPHPYKKVELEFTSEELHSLKKDDRELYDYLIQSISGVKE